MFSCYKTAHVHRALYLLRPDEIHLKLEEDQVGFWGGGLTLYFKSTI